VIFLGSYNGGSTGSGTVHALGDLRPGHSPATVSFGGDLIMGQRTVTQIELGGWQAGMFDQILVSGDLHLNGSLDVDLMDGFTLGRNQTFDVALVGGRVLGQFSNLSDGDRIGSFGGVDLYIQYHSSRPGGQGFSFFSAVPEPSTMFVLAIGSVALATRRRRR
jgi:hypothetical protein